jgi:hypothetical protein
MPASLLRLLIFVTETSGIFVETAAIVAENAGMLVETAASIMETVKTAAIFWRPLPSSLKLVPAFFRLLQHC